MQRRDFMTAGGAALAALALPAAAAARTPVDAPTVTDTQGPASSPACPGVPGRIAPLRADVGRITRITVCTRPFRAAGPRIELERIAGRSVIHNYGHGGGGWSLSWGSGMAVAGIARSAGAPEVAVIGCGIIGLTSAVVMQRQGIRVRICTRERAPDVRSFNATGVWSPDSRVGVQDVADAALWEELCRNSWRMFQSILGLPGHPVEWIDQYQLSDTPFGQRSRPRDPDAGPPAVRFADFGERVRDLVPAAEELPAGAHPFPVAHVRRGATMMFNIPAYMNWLEHEFLLNGGHIEYMDLRGPEDFRLIREKVIVNATGYGARALLGDDSLVPIRGQIARLVPQRELDYGLYYDGVSLTPRRDGPCVQAGTSGMDGYGNASVVPRRRESEDAVRKLAALYARLAPQTG